jgi:hypothetical protein
MGRAGAALLPERQINPQNEKPALRDGGGKLYQQPRIAV